MFINGKDGLHYEGKHYYSLLEGKTSNGYTSDIVFIFRDPTEQELMNGFSGEVIYWMYGAFRDLSAIENAIKEYEEKEVEKYEII